MPNTQFKKLGNFIKSLRINSGLTQKELALKLETTQSVIARIEAGQQNLSAGTLNKLSEIFNKPVALLAADDLDYVIEGGRKLCGEVTTNSSKNGAMGLMCASMLNQGQTILHCIPRIEEVNRIMEVMNSIGFSVKWIKENSLEIKREKDLDPNSMNAISAKRTRSAIMFAGPLAHEFKSFTLPHAQGCKLGKRTITGHIFGMEKLGLNFHVHSDSYEITHNGLKASEVIMYEAGDTATENVIMLASKIPGITTIKFASSNYMVQDVCFFLQKLGVQIEGIGTSTLKIHGQEQINKNIEFYNSEDPIESMLFLSAGITTDSNITIKRCPIDFLELELEKLYHMGLNFNISSKYKSYNERTLLADIEIFPSKLVALDDKIHPLPYPGINIDNLPFFVPIALKAKGQTLIHDWVYENRAIYYTELTKLGADITFADIHRVFIDGPSKLKGGHLVAPTAIRPAVVILIAMMAAEGTSILRSVYYISRAYQDIHNRFNELGANIRILKERI